MAKMDPPKNGMNQVAISYKTLIVLHIVNPDKSCVGDEGTKKSTLKWKHPLPFEKWILHNR